MDMVKNKKIFCFFLYFNAENQTVISYIILKQCLKIDFSYVLIQAASDQNLELIKNLLKHKVNINYQNQDGWTPLMWSVARPGIENKVTDFLLEKGAETNIKNNYNETAYDLAKGWGASDLAKKVRPSNTNH